MNTSYVEAAQLFQALADTTRLELLQLIEKGERCASELNTALAMSQPRIARHLKILVDAGLVLSRRDGRFVRYVVTSETAAREIVMAALGLIRTGPNRREAARGFGVSQSHLTVLQPVAPDVRTQPEKQAAKLTEPVDEPPRAVLEDFLL